MNVAEVVLIPIGEASTAYQVTFRERDEPSRGQFYVIALLRRNVVGVVTTIGRDFLEAKDTALKLDRRIAEEIARQSALPE